MGRPVSDGRNRCRRRASTTVRLVEILAASATDRSGALAIAGVLVDIQARQRRPLDIGDLPQPGDSPELFAIMPPVTKDE